VPPFSLAALTALELPPGELIEVASVCGYDHVGIRLPPATPGGLAYPLMENENSLRETIGRLDATGITVADLEVVAFRPETDIETFSAFLSTGERLGARHILVAAYDPDLGRFAHRFAGFCEAAQQHGLTVDLEFMPWTFVPDLVTANKIISEVRQPNAGVLVDALHFHRSNSAIDELAGVSDRQLHYWQLCDAPAERPATTEAMMIAARAERMFPGEGGIDLAPLIRAMPPDITVSIEVPTAELAKSMDATTRAKRALVAARNVISAARNGS